MSRPRGRAVRAAFSSSLVLGVVSGLAVVASPHAAFAASTAAINGSTTYQTIDGFGASEAFGQAATVMGLSSTEQKQVLDYLFSTSTGAGLSIVRNEIPTDTPHSIEPNAPSGPTATPTYTALGNDWGQEWLDQQAKSTYGVSQIYADAWSAPPYMKTNDDDNNGGTLCGVTGATCASGDWRQAYANYLIQYLKDYQADGLPVEYVGFENEPNLSPTYPGMVMSAAQSVSFIDTLGPSLGSSGTGTKPACCDTEGFDLAPPYVSAIQGDTTANADVGLITSHGYTQAPTALSTSKHVWETEWSTFESWDPSWDNGAADSGFTWAQHLYSGLTSADLNAFLYWWGTGTPTGNGDNESLVLINGSTVTPSGRLWAFANYSRYVRPGAVRIGATTGDGNLQLTAFKNTDGSVAIVALNQSSSSDSVNFSLANTGISDGASVTPYVTDASSNAAAQAPITVAGGAFGATLPARSLVTYVIPPGSGGGTTTSPPPTTTTSAPAGGCTVTYTPNQWTGGFTANLTIANTSSTPVNGWTLAFTFPGDQRVTNAWNAAVTQTGEAVTATNLSYNATIAPGATTTLGFQGTWTTNDTSPGTFTLNGTACT